MDLENKQINFKNIAKFISTVISWTIFTLLIICAMLLIYHFGASQIARIQGKKYTPKYSLYTIMSPSMTPNIKTYDVVVDIKPKGPTDIEIGDVISFISISPETKDMNITHRVVSIIKDEAGNYSFVTKGDANLIEDSVAVPYSNVIGKVTLKIPFLGRIQSFVANSYGWLLIIMIPAMYIIISDLIKNLKKNTIKDNEVLKVIDVKAINKEEKEEINELPELIENQEIKVEKEIEKKPPDENDDDSDFDLPELK